MKFCIYSTSSETVANLQGTKTDNWQKVV